MKRLMAFVTASLLVLASCSKQERAPTPEVAVQAEIVATHEITMHVQAEAVLFALRQAAITPRISAPVRKFFVQRGAKVHQGQLLARLESRDVSAAAEDARGGFQQAESSYKTATQAAVPEEYQKAKLDYEQAKTNLDVQQKIFDARQNLFKEGAVPGRDLDTARLSLVQAQSQFDQASKHLASANAVTREQAIRSAEGQLQSAHGKLRAAEASVSYTEIRSPIDGVVTDRPFFDGEMATAGTPLITVMETSSLLAKAHLPQAETQQLKIGDDATVTVQGLEKAIPGKVALVSPALDPGSTTVEVWVKVENKEGALKPGTAARVAIAAKTLKDALVVPSSALLKDDAGKTFVMVVENAMARKRDVQVGIADGEDVQIVEGLKAGEQVITTGSFGLDDRAKVKVVAGEKEADRGDGKKSEDKE